MMNWLNLIKQFFSSSPILSLSSSSSFFSSSIDSFGMRVCDDVHVKIRIDLMVDTKE